jgi:hypothetical protein
MKQECETRSEYKEYEVLTAVATKSAIFLGIAPCRMLKANRCFGGTSTFRFALLATRFKLVSCLNYSLNLTMEIIRFSETSVGFLWIHGVISQDIDLFNKQTHMIR